ncbi:MAG: FlgD immunoglobulin-like domain containing protein [Candidatus Cloacimonadaceae bacterium]|nr:FlgD immunoglobulin-like domain containing protein [Candidatus Cloacimonadaceae bacterium]
MRKCIAVAGLALIVLILHISNAGAQLAALRDPSIQPLSVFFNRSHGRETVLRSLTWQSFGGSWEDEDKYFAAYNAQGLCISILAMTWNYGTQEWDNDWIYEVSYQADNRLSHAEHQFVQDGVWTPTFVIDWVYDGGDLVQKSQRMYQNGEEIPYYDAVFVYDSVSGRLDNVVETFFISPTLQPQNKFVYAWDAPGRLIQTQKYQKHLGDPAWTIDLRNLYTYLPEDQSTHAEQLSYLETGFSLIGARYTVGVHPFLIDENALLYSPDEGTQWLDYYQTDYSYNPDLSLSTRQFIYRLGGANLLQDETRYAYENGLISTETYYLPVGNSGELAPSKRWIYEFVNSSATQDQTAPSLLRSLSVSPNPFVSQASIAFSLEKGGNVCIEVFNLRGQKVRGIQTGYLASGIHQLQWDGNDEQGRSLSSGIYLLRLSSAHESKTIKAVIAK